MTAAFLGFLAFDLAGCAAVLAQLAHWHRRDAPDGARTFAGIAACLTLAGFGFLLWSKGG